MTGPLPQARSRPISPNSLACSASPCGTCGGARLLGRIQPSGSGGFRRRRDVLHGALPAALGDVEHDAFRSLVLDLVIDVRVGLLAARDVAAAGGRDLL